MAFVAGKNLFFSLNGNNISAYCDSIDVERKIDSIDTTTFGQAGHTYLGGMTDGSIKVSGTYDSSASGPKAVFEPIMAAGLLVSAIYRPEGTGTGKPTETFSVLVTSYKESSKAADMIKWDGEMQISGTVTTATQP